MCLRTLAFPATQQQAAVEMNLTAQNGLGLHSPGSAESISWKTSWVLCEEHQQFSITKKQLEIKLKWRVNQRNAQEAGTLKEQEARELDTGGTALRACVKSVGELG